jgi:ferredoxin-NADP reductase
MHDHLRPGAVIGLGEATGDFVLPAASSKTLLLSGGSGATPCMAMVRDLARREALTDVVFVHAARSPRDVLFRRELEDLASRHAGLRVLFFLDDGGRRLAVEALHAAVPDLAERTTMLCGPTGMMEALAPIWSAPGLAHRLHVERFGPSVRRSPVAAAPSARVALTLLRSGRTVVTERSGTLLEQLELAGERPRSGCRMGICKACACRLRAGVVEDVVTGAVTDEPDQEIRLCVSRARTDVELAI